MRARKLAIVFAPAVVIVMLGGFLLRMGVGDPWAGPRGEAGSIPLDVIPVAPPYEAYLIPVGRFPLAERHASPLGDLIERLVGSVGEDQAASTELFLQIHRLRQGRGAEQVSVHGSQWQPEQGLGVWPDREAPRKWTLKDFLRLPGQGVRRQMYPVLHVAAEGDPRRQARRLMAGSGAGIHVVVRGAAGAYLAKARQLLLPPIRDRSFQSFPFYIPLLEAGSLQGAGAEQIEAWLCGATAYIRESAEDDGVLLIGRGTMRAAIERAGGRLESGSKARWRVPVAGPGGTSR